MKMEEKFLKGLVDAYEKARKDLRVHTGDATNYYAAEAKVLEARSDLVGGLTGGRLVVVGKTGVSTVESIGVSIINCVLYERSLL